jgi:hypothetical protein
MAIVFPASPSVNDTFTEGSITYKWDGDKWIGLGVTPADRLVEGSNSLEIDANNNLIWSGNNVGVNTSSPGVRFQVDYDEGAGERGMRLRAYNATNSKSWNISEITGNAGVLTFTNSTNGVDALSLVGSTGVGNTGAVLVGTTTYADGDTNQSRLVVEGNTSGDTSYAGILLRRGISTGVASGTSLGRIFFGDQNGDAGARISGMGDGTWASGSYPGRIEFDTKADGSDTWSNRMTIDKDGNVGIGHSTPASKLTIGGDAITTAKPTVMITDETNGGSVVIRGLGPRLVFDQTGGNDPKILTDTRDLVIYNGTLDSNGTELGRFTSNGIAFPSGKGIDFSANGNAAGIQSEILNDYEEGYATATMECGTSGTITLSNDEVSYVKVGDLVNIHGRLDVLSVSSPNGELIVNLPFNAANEGNGAYASHSAVSLFIWNGNSGAGYTQTGLYVGWISPNDNKIRIRYGSAATPASTASNAMQVGTEVRFTATFRTV